MFLMRNSTLSSPEWAPQPAHSAPIKRRASALVLGNEPCQVDLRLDLSMSRTLRQLLANPGFELGSQAGSASALAQGQEIPVQIQRSVGSSHNSPRMHSYRALFMRLPQHVPHY